MQAIKYLLLLVFVSSACSSFQYVGAKFDSGGATIEVAENGASCRIEYKSYDLLLNELRNRANTEMWSSEKIEGNKSAIPLGGRVIVHISASTIDAANTKYWEYVIQTLDGKEILRKEGYDEIPEYTVTQASTIWWNISIVDLRDKLSSPIKLFVIDKLMQRRSAYIIYQNGYNQK